MPSDTRSVALTAATLVGAAVVLSVVAGAAAAPRASARPSARAGAWQATLRYTRTRDGRRSSSRLHLTVTKSGSVVLDTPVVSRLQGASELQPGGYGKNKTLSFRELDGDSTPELLLDLFTGGAHCCWIEQVYDLTSATPRKTEISFADAGATLVSASGQTLFRSDDDSFAYEFTDYADSGEPIRLWAYAHDRFSDVTRQFPGLIRKDAAFWWSGYRARLKTHEDERGILSAWAADEAMLGNAAQAKQTLLKIADKGSLDWGFGLAKGTSYVRNLWTFLKHEGYLT